MEHRHYIKEIYEPFQSPFGYGLRFLTDKKANVDIFSAVHGSVVGGATSLFHGRGIWKKIHVEGKDTWSGIQPLLSDLTEVHNIYNIYIPDHGWL